MELCMEDLRGLGSITKRTEQARSQTHEVIVDNKVLLEKLVLWERSELDEPETLALFQVLVSSGLAWKATGAVRRTAAQLLREGRIQRK